MRVDLPARQRAALERLARERGESPADLAARVLSDALSALSAGPGSSALAAPFADLDDLLREVGDGPSDLSVNPEHLRGFGAPR